MYWASATGTQGVRRMPVGVETGKAGGDRIVGGLQFYLQEPELSLVGNREPSKVSEQGNDRL